jgi:DNA-binding XRE family transcriptional regulator
MSMGERLRRAREAAGFETAKEAADALGIPTATYIQHENGTRGFPAKRAASYAEFFRTSTDWLLYGRNPRPQRGDGVVPVIGRVGADPEGRVLFATGDNPNAYVPAMPGGTEKAAALEVVGHSMRGFVDSGGLLYFEDQHTPPTVDMLGEVVIVETDTDEVLVKRLLRGSKRNQYDLESISGPTRKDVRLRWAAHISAIIPPHNARKIIRRAGEAA